MEFKEGHTVIFHYNEYYVYDIKGTKLTLVPIDALDWETGILKLNNAFQVESNRVQACQ